MEDEEGLGAASRNPQDDGGAEGDQRRAVDVGTSLLVPRHSQQLEEIEAVIGQREGGREESHCRVPHGRLEHRVPLEAQDDQEHESEPGKAVPLEYVGDPLQPLHAAILRIEAIPKTGPSANIGKAHGHPRESVKAGTP